MTSNTEFSSITDNFASALLRAQDDIAKWTVSETGMFLREVSADTRTVMERPERAGANLRAFVQENPDAILRFSAGCLAMIKVMAAKPAKEASKDRHPAGKSRKAKLSVVEDEQLKEATEGLSYVEALMDGWDPSKADFVQPEGIIGLRLAPKDHDAIVEGFASLVRDEIANLEQAGVDTEGDRIAAAYLLDISGALRKPDLNNALEMLAIMQTSVSTTCKAVSRRMISLLSSRFGV